VRTLHPYALTRVCPDVAFSLSALDIFPSSGYDAMPHERGGILIFDLSFSSTSVESNLSKS
jgi:hypothetical protein